MAATLPPKCFVVSVGISQTSYVEVVSLCREWALERRTQNPPCARIICVTSVHGIITARDDPGFAHILNTAEITTPDGMPVVWALRSFGCPNQQRVYGPTLMWELCRDAANHGRKIFLYGSHRDTLDTLTSRLHRQFPRLIIAGIHSPPFRPLSEAEKVEIRKQIIESDADLVFVGISTPKQERWMYENRNHLPGITLIGVGAAFDFHAGRTRQAPAWMQRNGLEWLFRLVTEPVRLWRRYLLTTPRFLPLWLKQKLSSRSA